MSSKGELEEKVLEVLRQIYDPEIPVDIYELGLIYDLEIDEKSVVSIQMTLTAPGCPVADSLVNEVMYKVKTVPGVSDARVELVWDPPWDMDRMSEAARLTLGM